MIILCAFPRREERGFEMSAPATLIHIKIVPIANTIKTIMNLTGTTTTPTAILTHSMGLISSMVWNGLRSLSASSCLRINSLRMSAALSRFARLFNMPFLSNASAMTLGADMVNELVVGLVCNIFFRKVVVVKTISRISRLAHRISHPGRQSQPQLTHKEICCNADSCTCCPSPTSLPDVARPPFPSLGFQLPQILAPRHELCRAIMRPVQKTFRKIMITKIYYSTRLTNHPGQHYPSRQIRRFSCS
mmetsp:Transcript_18311/g.29791  ORF Transcript_18311/g.29791 Transcript_18311/m.29791 type:complete len:247 (-) Transcript_18311:873-1613(-)